MLQVYVHKTNNEGARQVSIVRPQGVRTIRFSPQEAKNVSEMCVYLTRVVKDNHDGYEATVVNGASSEVGHELAEDEFAQILRAIQSGGISVVV